MLHESIVRFVKQVISESLEIKFTDVLLYVKSIGVEFWEIGLKLLGQKVIFANVSCTVYTNAYEEVMYLGDTEVLAKDLTVIKYKYNSETGAVYLYRIHFYIDYRVQAHIKKMIYNIVDDSLLTSRLEAVRMKELYNNHIECNDWDIPDED